MVNLGIIKHGVSRCLLSLVPASRVPNCGHGPSATPPIIQQPAHMVDMFVLRTAGFSNGGLKPFVGNCFNVRRRCEPVTTLRVHYLFIFSILVEESCAVSLQFTVFQNAQFPARWVQAQLGYCREALQVRGDSSQKRAEGDLFVATVGFCVASGTWKSSKTWGF